jgi:hypothetical protein
MPSRATSLIRNEFVELDVHFGERVVVIRRTAERFARVADVDNAIEAIARALPLERRQGHAVLIDMRVAPVRTDPALEPAFARYRVETERGFERVVVVVTSVVGRIRSDRLGQVTRIPLTIVGSLEEAWNALRRP